MNQWIKAGLLMMAGGLFLLFMAHVAQNEKDMWSKTPNGVGTTCINEMVFAYSKNGVSVSIAQYLDRNGKTVPCEKE